jgi:hypothetical protein
LTSFVLSGTDIITDVHKKRKSNLKKLQGEKKKKKGQAQPERLNDYQEWLR